LLAYCLNSKKSAEIIAGTVSHKTINALAKELAVPCTTRPDLNDCRWVEHISLSVPQNEILDKKKFAEIVKDFMKELGFPENFLWVAVIHHDTPSHLHVHIIANRIALDGRLYGGQKEAKRGMKICDALEIKYGLTRTNREGKGKGLKRDELSMMLRMGKLSTKQQIRAVVSSVLKLQPKITLKEFDEKLSFYGVAIDLNISSTGHISGLTYTKDGLSIKGSSIGYSWSTVSRHLTAEHSLSAGLNQDMERVSRTR
jgi:hypothetical protein